MTDRDELESGADRPESDEVTGAAAEDETEAEPTEAGEPETEQEEAAPPKVRLGLQVEISDSGPCRKHVRIRVPQDDIDRFRSEVLGEFTTTAEVPGFRVGRVPKQLIARRYRSELNDKVKQRVLIESMEQLAEDEQLDPINEPHLDIETIQIPDEGDFEYEFDVEVRPEFDLPEYKGLTIRRPVHAVSDSDVEAYKARFLAQYGQLVDREGAAQPDDHVTVSVDFQHEGRHLRTIPQMTVRLAPVLRFQDAELEGFNELLAGAEPGAKRETDVSVSYEAESLELRGETVHAVFTVKAVKAMQPPELNKEFFQRIGVESEQELDEQIRETLERQAVYQQRQAAREEVIEKLIEASDWDLPEDLLRKQVENALRREILEMQQAGFTSHEIRSRENELRQNAVSVTRHALIQHFVLDRIAEQENIEVTPADIQTEIQLMAAQAGESARRVRARMEKSGEIENLEAQVRERKAVDVILSHAEYEDVEVEAPSEIQVEAVSHSVCGAMPAAAAREAAESPAETQ